MICIGIPQLVNGTPKYHVAHELGADNARVGRNVLGDLHGAPQCGLGRRQALREETRK